MNGQAGDGMAKLTQSDALCKLVLLHAVLWPHVANPGQGLMALPRLSAGKRLWVDGVRCWCRSGRSRSSSYPSSPHRDLVPISPTLGSPTPSARPSTEAPHTTSPCPLPEALGTRASSGDVSERSGKEATSYRHRGSFVRASAPASQRASAEERAARMASSSFDLDAYISNYTGYTRLRRLAFIASKDSSLRIDALRIALDEVRAEPAACMRRLCIARLCAVPARGVCARACPTRRRVRAPRLLSSRSRPGDDDDEHGAVRGAHQPSDRGRRAVRAR